MITPRSRLGRKPAQRRMLLRNIVTSLILYESIRTTKERARAVRPVVDRMIATAKTRPPHTAIRSFNRIVTDANASRKIFGVLADRFRNRSSGFTRIRPIGRRKGDGAKMVEIALVSEGKDDDTSK